MRIKRTTLAALAGATLLAGLAVGQTVPSGPMADTPSVQAGDHGLDRLDRRLAGLHRRLAITAAQEPQWTAFAAVVRQNAQTMQSTLARGATHAGAVNALEELHAFAELARLRAEDMQRLLPAFQALYETLSPEQRATADRIVQQFLTRGEGRHRARP